MPKTGKPRRRRLSISVQRKPALQISRRALKANKLVYIALANRPIKYKTNGSSRVAYIGTTGRGVKRIAKSADVQARRLLRVRGLRSLDFHIVTCTRRQGIAAWERLERALIAAFRQKYGEPPRGNRQGKHFKWKKREDRLFREKRLLRVLAELDRMGE